MALSSRLAEGFDHVLNCSCVALCYSFFRFICDVIHPMILRTILLVPLTQALSLKNGSEHLEPSAQDPTQGAPPRSLVGHQSPMRAANTDEPTQGYNQDPIPDVVDTAASAQPSTLPPTATHEEPLKFSAVPQIKGKPSSFLKVAHS